MKYSLSSPAFFHVFKNSKSLATRGLLIKYKKNNLPKLGFSVSRKYGNAIERNLFKRRFRHLFNLFIVKNGLNFSIIVFPKKASLSFFDIKKSIQSLNDKLSN